jgi:dUTP pyrophosphatase
MNDLLVPIKILDDVASVPTYAHPGDAGVDLVSTMDMHLGPRERAVIGTGIAIALPPGFAGFIHPRSGLAARSGVSIVNTPGTIDAGYRGEVKVVLINTDRAKAVTIRRGDRIAQLVIHPVYTAHFAEVDELEESDRSSGGFGSTGVA